MSLLEEGIATGNVLPTGRKEKHSIDNVTRDFDIYRIKCDLLFYNDQNVVLDRFGYWDFSYNLSCLNSRRKRRSSYGH